MELRYSTLFSKRLRSSLAEMTNPKALTFYGSSIVIFAVVSLLLPYQTQVYLSIGAGFAVAILLPLSMVLSRGLKSIDVVFIAGILFLIVALFNSGLPVRAVFENLRHFSLILSVALTGLYVTLVTLRFQPRAKSMKSFGLFSSVFTTTLSSELCSCLHPTLLLEALGIPAFLQNQVKLGFIIMMTTLASQTRVTHQTYKSRRH